MKHNLVNYKYKYEGNFLQYPYFILLIFWMLKTLNEVIKNGFLLIL